MLISELSKKTGISVDTIRFYEKIGLLTERYIKREENNYRKFPEDAIERLAIVKTLHDAGFSLREILDLFDKWDGGKLSPHEGEILLNQKIDEIDARIKEMRQVKKRVLSILGAHKKR